jgi:ABC-type polysaccharide/polyol phosphate export permease
VRLPYSLHAYRLVYRNLLVLGHNILILPAILVIFKVPIHWGIVIAVPATLLLCVNGVWISILFGMLSARYRDVPPIVASFIQVIFFVTPIFWSPDLLGYWKSIGELNPLFAAVDIVRAPLLGMSPAPFSWLIVLVGTLVGGSMTFVLFARFRPRIAFWV